MKVDMILRLSDLQAKINNILYFPPLFETNSAKYT